MVYRKNTSAMLLILAQLLLQIKAAITPPPPPPPPPICNSFPKIFGGTHQDSYIHQIDVFNDYLAMVGDTFDQYLTGSLISRQHPYIGLASIATSGKYYWAKALDQSLWFSLTAVQFSEDGALLIAHSAWTWDSFIVVFEVTTGNIKSARSYSWSTGFQNYYNGIKSMVVSSGPQPMAYVLSNYRSSSECTGQHFFNFDPLSFSPAPVWIKQTLGTTNCGHLGLVFGRNQGFLYAFSTYNGYATVSLVQINGNAYWQYATPDVNYNGNQIQYKAIDASTDMILATSGFGFINYNRIISSSTSPYSVSVTESKAYRDPNINIHLQTRALYIVNKDNAKSLIFNTYYCRTDLASIDFSALTITYKRALPQISSCYLTPGVFVSDTVFYVGTHSNYIQRDDTYGNLINDLKYENQAIVYTSNMTLTSCYTISPAAARAPVTMVTNPINSLASSIYTTSSVTFVNFTGGYSSIDIIQSAFVKVNWCLQYPLSINQVTQATSTFSLFGNVAEQILGITPFSATVNCGTHTNTFSYAGFDNSTGLALSSYASDLITVYSVSGSIKVAQAKPEGSYYIKVVGTLPDLQSEKFNLKNIQ